MSELRETKDRTVVAQRKSKYDVHSVIQTFVCKMNDSEDQNYKMTTMDGKSETE